MWRKERCNVFFFCGVKVFAALPICGGFGRLCRFAGKGAGGGWSVMRIREEGGTGGGMNTVVSYGMVRFRVGLPNRLSLAR